MNITGLGDDCTEFGSTMMLDSQFRTISPLVFARPGTRGGVNLVAFDWFPLDNYDMGKYVNETRHP